MAMADSSANPIHIPSYPTVEAILDTIADWVGRCRRALGASKELGTCGPEEVARIAHELGVGRGELYELASRGPRSADLLQKMLPALGIDLKELSRTDPLVVRDLQRLCVTCNNKGRCQHELADGTAADDYQDFCPNAVTLDALVRARGP